MNHRVWLVLTVFFRDHFGSCLGCFCYFFRSGYLFRIWTVCYNPCGKLSLGKRVVVPFRLSVTHPWLFFSFLLLTIAFLSIWEFVGWIVDLCSLLCASELTYIFQEGNHVVACLAKFRVDHPWVYWKDSSTSFVVSVYHHSLSLRPNLQWIFVSKGWDLNFRSVSTFGRNIIRLKGVNYRTMNLDNI